VRSRRQKDDRLTKKTNFQKSLKNKPIPQQQSHLQTGHCLPSRKGCTHVEIKISFCIDEQLEEKTNTD
jgi:hypothetical protein